MTVAAWIASMEGARQLESDTLFQAVRCLGMSVAALE